MTKSIAGIDPGLDGAIALVSSSNIIIFDMPTFELKGKRHVDNYGLARFFDLHASDIVRACVEDPNAMPHDGVASAHKFGVNCGVVKQAVASCFIPMFLVKPAKWKMAMGLSSDKDASRALASRMFPKFSHLWPLKKHEGRCEAVLLAVYGAKL